MVQESELMGGLCCWQLVSLMCCLHFVQGAFDSLENEEDEDIELDLMARKMKGPVTEPANDPDDDEDEDEDEDDDEDGGSDGEADGGEKSESDDDSDSSDSDSDYDVHKDFKDKSQASTDEGPAAAGKARGKKRSLTAEALALGSMMIHSKKAKRDITDDSWCRYVSNDDNLPDWFVEDERRHYRKELPITKVRTRAGGKRHLRSTPIMLCIMCRIGTGARLP